MAITREEFADLVNPAIREIFDATGKEWPEEFSRVFTIEKSTKKEEIDSAITGFGAAPVKVEGADVTYDVPYQGYDYTYTHVTYGLGFVVTMEMMQDDLHGKIKRLPRALQRAMRETREVQAAAVFNNAFSGTTYGDAKALIVNDHPNPSGGADGTNVLATPADLAPTSLKAALTQMRKMSGFRGEKLMLKPDLLLIPPDLEFDACQILDSTLLAGSANNDINSIRKLYPGVKPTILTRLTDTDAWFVLADNREELIFWKRHEIDLKDDLYIASRNVEYNSVMRFSVGASGWMFALGTPGA